MSEIPDLPERPRLREDLPFKRIAVVLSGGGAWGAYEIGVFKALEAIGLRPNILAGVSVGAINAVVWLAHGFRTRWLERAWAKIRGSSIGMRWVTLILRMLGVFLVVLAIVEILLALAGSPELKVLTEFRQLRDAWGFGLASLVFEIIAWIALGVVGYAMAFLTRRLEDLLGKYAGNPESDVWRLWVDVTLVLAAILYPIAMLMRWPWPWRFHGLVLVALTVIWLADRPGLPSHAMRRLVLGLMPETRGRGLWRSNGRRRLIDRLVAQGDPRLLVDTDVHLIISACSVTDGRMSYFVNWDPPSERFVDHIHAALGDVVPLTRPRDLIDATTAASAVPVLFEPVRWRGREYLDGGIFSNQPIHAVVADGADAILLVLVSPSSGPRAASETSVVELGWRLQELANWRDLQTELRQLDGRWKEEATPHRLCVVEPSEPLPGWMFAFDPGSARSLIERGEADAWKALLKAGWITARPADRPARGPKRERWQREVEWLTRASRVLVAQGGRLQRKVRGKRGGSRVSPGDS